MIEPIHRLVYFSHNRIVGSADMLIAGIDDILAASRRNNPKVDVTGALMFNSACFAQVLEGPEAGVANVFERIQQDARHGEVSVLSYAQVPGRAFERWSMAFVGESAVEGKRFASIADQTDYDPSVMTGDRLFETLHRLVLNQLVVVP